MFFFILALGIVIGGLVMIASNLQSQQTTTTYTLEDGTVLNDCWNMNFGCGMTLRDCSNTKAEYECQQNVKITTEPKKYG